MTDATSAGMRAAAGRGRGSTETVSVSQLLSTVFEDRIGRAWRWWRFITALGGVYVVIAVLGGVMQLSIAVSNPKVLFDIG